MPRPAMEILAAISLVVIAAVLFLRRTFGDGLTNLPAAEVMLYAALFAAASGMVSDRLRRISHAPVPPHALLALGFLVSLAFTAGLAADPFDAFGSLVAIVAVLAISHRDQFSAWRQNATPSGETGSVQERGEGKPLDDCNVSQSITRRVVGSDCHIEGMMSFDIPPGESIHQLHIPFWPLLPGIPEVECEVDGLDARLRVPLAAAHGLRIEVRAAQASDATRQGILHVSAYASSSRAAA